MTSSGGILNVEKSEGKKMFWNLPISNNANMTLISESLLLILGDGSVVFDIDIQARENCGSWTFQTQGAQLSSSLLSHHIVVCPVLSCPVQSSPILCVWVQCKLDNFMFNISFSLIWLFYGLSSNFARLTMVFLYGKLRWRVSRLCLKCCLSTCRQRLFFLASLFYWVIR